MALGLEAMLYHRNKFRCYKMIQACGLVSLCQKTLCWVNKASPHSIGRFFIRSGDKMIGEVISKQDSKFALHSP